MEIGRCLTDESHRYRSAAARPFAEPLPKKMKMLQSSETPAKQAMPHDRTTPINSRRNISPPIGVGVRKSGDPTRPLHPSNSHAGMFAGTILPTSTSKTIVSAPHSHIGDDVPPGKLHLRPLSIFSSQHSSNALFKRFNH